MLHGSVLKLKGAEGLISVRTFFTFIGMPCEGHSKRSLHVYQRLNKILCRLRRIVTMLSQTVFMQLTKSEMYNLYSPVQNKLEQKEDHIENSIRQNTRATKRNNRAAIWVP